MRPKEKIFDMAWRPENKTKEEIAEGKSLMAKYHIQSAERFDELFDVSPLDVGAQTFSQLGPSLAMIAKREQTSD